MANLKKDPQDKKNVVNYTITQKIKERVKIEADKGQYVSASAWVEDAIIQKLKKECGYTE